MESLLPRPRGISGLFGDTFQSKGGSPKAKRGSPNAKGGSPNAKRGSPNAKGGSPNVIGGIPNGSGEAGSDDQQVALAAEDGLHERRHREPLLVVLRREADPAGDKARVPDQAAAANL